MTTTPSDLETNRPPSTVHRRIVALAGGVGGAKLAHGLAMNLPPEDLTVIVNTGMTSSIMACTSVPTWIRSATPWQDLPTPIQAGAAWVNPGMPSAMHPGWADLAGSTWETRTWAPTWNAHGG